MDYRLQYNSYNVGTHKNVHIIRDIFESKICIYSKNFIIVSRTYIYITYCFDEFIALTHVNHVISAIILYKINTHDTLS